jgi:xanthine dehydrogenase YagS FAD-binding subunit
MKEMLVTPERVVSLAGVASLKAIEDTASGVRIGAMVTLDDLLDSPELDRYPALKQAAGAIGSQLLQSQGTVGGELCQKPRCWYFRAGHGMLADGGQMAADGDNRYHAILGNAGPAKFVSASRLAPALIALGAAARLLGPEADDQRLVPLADFFRTPRDEREAQTVLRPGQFLTHIMLPEPAGWTSAAYDVRHGTGPDDPLASAAASILLRAGVVADARIVLGHVAPIPWVSAEAAEALIGRAVDQQTAEAAGDAAVTSATPLSDNVYKVQLARVAVKRAVLLAAGLETGGF